MDTDLTVEEQATNYQTLTHIRLVTRILHACVVELLRRADAHDRSKLERPEIDLFAKAKPIGPMTYGSKEFEEQKKRDLGPALAHHYGSNDHHPEHFKEVSGVEVTQIEGDIRALERDDGLPEPVRHRLLTRLRSDLAAVKSSVNGMNLFQVLEMLCDWKASSTRHHDGNIRKSIEINADRFGLSPQLARILENTASHFADVR